MVASASLVTHLRGSQPSIGPDGFWAVWTASRPSQTDLDGFKTGFRFTIGTYHLYMNARQNLPAASCEARSPSLLYTAESNTATQCSLLLLSACEKLALSTGIPHGQRPVAWLVHQSGNTIVHQTLPLLTWRREFAL